MTEGAGELQQDSPGCFGIPWTKIVWGRSALLLVSLIVSVPFLVQARIESALGLPAWLMISLGLHGLLCGFEALYYGVVVLDTLWKRSPVRAIGRRASLVGGAGAAPILAWYAIRFFHVDDRCFLAQHRAELERIVATGDSESHDVWRVGDCTVVRMGSIGILDSYWLIHAPSERALDAPGADRDTVMRYHRSFSHLGGPWYVLIS